LKHTNSDDVVMVRTKNLCFLLSTMLNTNLTLKGCVKGMIGQETSIQILECRSCGYFVNWVPAKVE